jgi:hypothetical protein
MTIGTILYYSQVRELPVMVIRMTVCAKVMPDRVGEICLMAFCAGHDLVFSFQLKVGFGMIEIRDPFYGMKILCRMTLNAILAEFILMNIQMAGCTIPELNPGKGLEFHPVLLTDRMAFETWHFQVLSCQRVPGIGMIKVNGRFK